MYRQYENIRELEELLEMLEYDRAEGHYLDDEHLFAIEEEIEDLRQRINFAYQDEEFDETWED